MGSPGRGRIRKSGDKQAGGVGFTGADRALKNEHTTRSDRHAPQLRLDRAFNRLRADRRHVEPEILPALWRFHPDARQAGKAQPAVGAHPQDR